MRISIVAARDNNNGIGKDGMIPWTCPEDMRHFSRLTKSGKSNAVIMGRATFSSIGSPLPGRANVVISSTIKQEAAQGYYLCQSYEEGLRCCEELGVQAVWICGGERIYDAALRCKSVDKCYLTDIDGSWSCDRHFPELDAAIWQEESVLKLSKIATLRVFCPKRKEDCQ